MCVLEHYRHALFWSAAGKERAPSPPIIIRQSESSDTLRKQSLFCCFCVQGVVELALASFRLPDRGLTHTPLVTPHVLRFHQQKKSPLCLSYCCGYRIDGFELSSECYVP